ncbi:hypothetical protein FG386_000757 [Cryptosporidium ryanae]|uniref:uncharacterized protein n=1 Tax=Cryptosporidium ryanae TaxID=515981 RepID=UPI00351A5EFB|nr:hypothetical protein FG386_000757 [Cryptosporidium ryanae]
MRGNINSLKGYSEINLLFHLIKYNYQRNDFLINNLLLNIILGEVDFNRYSNFSRIYSIQHTYRGLSLFEALNIIRNKGRRLRENDKQNIIENSANKIFFKYKGREIVSETFENLPTIISHKEYYLGRSLSLAYWSCFYRDMKKERINFFNVVLVFDEQNKKDSELERNFNIKIFSKSNQHFFDSNEENIEFGKHQLNYGGIFVLFYFLSYLYHFIESKVKVLYSKSDVNVEETFVKRLLKELNHYIQA